MAEKKPKSNSPASLVALPSDMVQRDLPKGFNTGKVVDPRIMTTLPPNMQGGFPKPGMPTNTGPLTSMPPVDGRTKIGDPGSGYSGGTSSTADVGNAKGRTGKTDATGNAIAAQALPAIAQTFAETGTAVKNDLFQGAGLLRMDSLIPQRVDAISGWADSLARTGADIFDRYQSRAYQRADAASNWDRSTFPEFRAIQDNQRIRSAELEGVRRNTESWALNTDALGRDHVIRATQARDFQKDRVSQSETMFNNDWGDTLDRLGKNVASDLESIRSSADGVADSMMQEGMNALIAEGRENDPVAVAELKNKTRRTMAQTMGQQRHQRQAEYENTLRTVYGQRAMSRSELMTNNTKLLGDAFDQVSQASAARLNTQLALTQFMGTFQEQNMRDQQDLFKQSTEAAMGIASFLNNIDRDTATIDYALNADYVNLQLSAEQLQVQQIMAGAGVLINWSHIVPNLMGIAQSAGLGGGGGGGGGGGSSFSPSLSLGARAG